MKPRKSLHLALYQVWASKFFADLEYHQSFKHDGLLNPHTTNEGAKEIWEWITLDDLPLIALIVDIMFKLNGDHEDVLNELKLFENLYGLPKPMINELMVWVYG